MREADKRMYYIVSPNSFAYNPARINVGSIGYQNIGKNVIVSSLYEVFKTSEDVDDRLLWHWFKSSDFQKLIMQLQEGGVRLYFYYDKLCMGEVSLPSLDEQRKIGKLFDTLDNLITLHQRKCANLCSPSQVVFSLLFATSTFSWEQRKLGEVIRLNGRIGFRGYTEKDIVSKDDGGVLTFSPTNIVDNKLTTNCKNTYITRFKYDESPEIKIHNGDILFVKTGSTLGKSALVTGLSEDATLNPQVVVMRTNNLNVEFLAAMLVTNAIISQVNSAKIGGAVPTLTETRIKDFDVAIPVSEAEKEQIGQFFSQLDNLITLHQRECISFTGRADRLILTANKKRTTSSWEQRKLGDVVQITMGQSPDGSTYSDEPSDYILVQGNADLQNGWVCPRIWTTQITKKADAGDLIMSVRAPAGAMGKTAYNAVIGRGVAAIKGNEFIYQLLVKMDADGFWKTLSCGSTFESLNSDNIKNAEVKIPTTAEQIKIGGYFQQLDNLITLHQRKPFLMKWRTSDANRNQTNRLVL